MAGSPCLFEPGDDGRASLVSEPSLATKVGMKKRGSSSLGFPKNHYAFEVWGEGDNAAREVEIRGMPAESDWILNGPYTDKTLLRDYLSYDWSNQIGRWCVR